MTRPRSALLACLLITSLPIVYAHDHEVERFRASLLPGLTDEAYGYAFNVNNRGQIAGCVRVPGEFGDVHAVLWEPLPSGGYSVADLGTLGGGSSCAYGINERGDVVGSSLTASGVDSAFLWRDGHMTDLGTLLTNPDLPSGSTQSQAYAINDLGRIVGWSETDSGRHHAFVWQHGTMVDLGSLGPVPDDLSEAYDIDNRGRIVGNSLVLDSETNEVSQHIVIWRRGGAIVDLGIGGQTAYAINERGAVAGQWNGPTGHAFLWKAGHLLDLGVLDPIGNDSIAFGLNNRGQVVGSSVIVPDPEQSDRYDKAFIWEEGVMTPLPQLPDTEGGGGIAYAINDRGQAVGQSLTATFGVPLPVVWARHPHRD